MIRSLHGTITNIDGQRLTIITQGGVGYGIATIRSHQYQEGDLATVHTHLAVRETALDLYGFSDIATRDFFELLLTIPKIGPKSALGILDQAEISTIIEAVQTKDAGFLTKMTGMGKKTAENIVAALQDKIEAVAYAQPITPRSEYQDAFDALVTFGYQPQDIRRILDTIESSSTSDLITLALKELR